MVLLEVVALTSCNDFQEDLTDMYNLSRRQKDINLRVRVHREVRDAYTLRGNCNIWELTDIWEDKHENNSTQKQQIKKSRKVD